MEDAYELLIPVTLVDGFDLLRIRVDRVPATISSIVVRDVEECSNAPETSCIGVKSAVDEDQNAEGLSAVLHLLDASTDAVKDFRNVFLVHLGGNLLVLASIGIAFFVDHDI